MDTSMAIYEPRCSLCVYMSLIVKPAANNKHCLTLILLLFFFRKEKEFPKNIKFIENLIQYIHIVENQTYDFRTALLKVEADENVFPSRYLFSPLILCLILMSNSSALTTKGVSEACPFSTLLLFRTLQVRVYINHMICVYTCMFSYHDPSPSVSIGRNMSWIRHNICTSKRNTKNQLTILHAIWLIKKLKSLIMLTWIFYLHLKTCFKVLKMQENTSVWLKIPAGPACIKL